jgi:urea carboxylase
LAKVVTKAKDRDEALAQLQNSLESAVIGGVQTNTAWLCKILKTPEFQEATITTKFIAQNKINPDVVEVLRSGVQTTVQDYPGRRSMWNVGVPPSGPMDDYSFRLGNQILGNDAKAAGLECLLQGPKLRFHVSTRVCVTGAKAEIKLNGEVVQQYHVISVKPSDVLDVGKVIEQGSRIYVLFSEGIQTPAYLNSRSTFTLGKFGGHCGRPLLVGDCLPLVKDTEAVTETKSSMILPMENHWSIHVLMGPHTAPEFFTTEDIDDILDTKWKVHFNSDRTGVRLIGPQPKWAREDGGEAGLHPSNIHDNAYAIGAMDFTGDQPVLLGPDGPSLGGFVCPITIIKADLWKMGQLRSDDEISFVPVSYEKSQELLEKQEESIQSLSLISQETLVSKEISSPILFESKADPKLVIRQSGDMALLCEFGALELDLDLRIHAHFFMEELQKSCSEIVEECTPGIRSIQIQFKNISRDELIQRCIKLHDAVAQQTQHSFRSRIIHLPLSWNDPSTLLAIEKYVTNVRPDAPWCCPDNIEFIRRVNGLDNVQQVKDIVYDAKYLVMGLGDVYLGAPVAVPVDPRHRLITTKYNPARTWTPENAVGIGGAYMCIYGMEGPGGYQFVGRTLPVWNRYKQTENFSNPFLLRFFDQISFFEVGSEELLEYREAFIHGQYQIKIEETQFDIQNHKAFLAQHKDSCRSFKTKQTQAFEAEKQRWIEQGVFSFDSETSSEDEESHVIPPGATVITSPVSGAVWKIVASENDTVEEDQPLMILEAMKMEMGVYSPCQGKLSKIFIEPGQTVQAGQHLGYII